MPHVVSLWEAMEEEERWAISALDAVDDHLRLRGNEEVELREPFKHL